MGRGGWLLVGWMLLLMPVTAAGADVSVSFGFEPRVGAYASQDPEFEAHGYAPVGSAVLPAWGLRGRLFFDSGLFAQLTMSYGLRVAPGTPAPTTVTLIDTTAGLGYRFPWGGFAALDVGFEAMTVAVSSALDGGALVYLGPSVHPRIGWLAQVTEPLGWFVAITAGLNLHLPVGRPHANPLWEHPFRQSVIPAFTLGLESGFGLKGGR